MSQMSQTGNLTVDKLFGVRGQVAVVTGGGTGIGLMCTQALAANGCKVYITSRRPEAIDKAAEHHDPNHEGAGDIIPIGPCDVTKKEDLERLVKEISSKEDHVDILVTSAGISGPKNPPDTDDVKELKDKLWTGESFEDWSSVYTTNVSALYFTAVAFLPLLKASTDQHPGRSASIITISSMSGLMADSQGHFSYNASKGAAVHLTKLMASEFRRIKVRVNSIAPGYFPSEMTTKSSDETQKSELPKEKIQEKGEVPAGRAGNEHDMAQACLFLACNMYVNGEVLVVDGGVMLHSGGR